jgi:hypothetical protein
MRIGCKGHVKVKLDPREGCWFFDVIDLKHNLQLHPEKRMTLFMRAHKSMEDGVKNLMDVMTRAGVHYQTQMNVVSLTLKTLLQPSSFIVYASKFCCIFN